MDNTNLEMIITVDRFNSICRTCLRDLKAVAFNINGFLFPQQEDGSEEAKKLAIFEVFSKYTSIKVSKSF